MTSVLLVDDETGARTMLAMALRGSDVTVETAADGSTALSLVKMRGYDWVISDVRLPGIDGIALVTEIARIRPQTRLLLISAVADEDDVHHLPICAFWRKPFDPLALRRAIQEGAPAPVRR